MQLLTAIHQDLQNSVRTLAPVVREYGVWIVFGGLLAESAGVVFAPGETLLRNI
jgi:hypothetical protein